MAKKLLALILALVCCFALLAGCGGEDTDSTAGSKKNSALENYERPDLTGVTLTQYMTANNDYEAEGSYANEIVEELLGVNYQIIELDSFNTQYLTMMAEGNVPDVTWLNSYMQTFVTFGEDGAYINIYDYLDMMPNLEAFLNDPANALDVARYQQPDGALYAIPSKSEGVTAPWTFLYRKDIFEANGLTFPTNQEEFVATLRKLKELYPDSQPFIMRQMTGNIGGAQNFGHLWGAAHVMQGNYGTIFTLDENGEYFMAQQSNAYKEMAQFFNELTAEGLMHKSSMTVDTAGWMEAFASDTSFIGYDKTDRLSALNRTGQSLKEEFLMVAAAPFNFGSYAETTDVVSTSWADGIGSGSGYCYCIGDNENLENTLKYIDWLYSEEGIVVTNWGIEGESWEYDEDGNRKYVDGFLDEVGGHTKSGLGSTNLTGYRLLDAYVKSLTAEETESLLLAQEYVSKSPAQHKLQFTEEEQLLYDTYATACYNYAQTQWSKFVLGQRDFSEWDQVVEEMKASYKYDELMEIHYDSLARVLEENGVSYD